MTKVDSGARRGGFWGKERWILGQGEVDSGAVVR